MSLTITSISRGGRVLGCGRMTKNINDPHLPESGAIPRAKQPIVVCVSLQDLHINVDGSTKDRLRQVVATEWDLIIFDEVHLQLNGASEIHHRKPIGLKLKKRLDLSWHSVSPDPRR